MTADSTTPLLELRGMSKHYGSIRAVDNFDLTINRGQIVALVGDNGAGKSTVAKMVAGAVHPDHGEIRVDGEVRQVRSPLDARALGIETIYQDLALLPNLDVTTNLFLGREETHSGLLRRVG